MQKHDGKRPTAREGGGVKKKRLTLAPASVRQEPMEGGGGWWLGRKAKRWTLIEMKSHNIIQLRQSRGCLTAQQSDWATQKRDKEFLENEGRSGEGDESQTRQSSFCEKLMWSSSVCVTPVRTNMKNVKHRKNKPILHCI